MINKLSELLASFKKLSIKAKFMSLWFFGFALFLTYSFLTRAPELYSNREDQIARQMARVENEKLKQIHGFTVTKEIMGAKPVRGWGITFLYAYDYADTEFFSELKKLGWRYVGEFEFSDLITKETPYSQFCKEAIKMSIFHKEGTSNSIYIELGDEKCGVYSFPEEQK